MLAITGEKEISGRNGVIIGNEDVVKCIKQQYYKETITETVEEN